MNDDEVLRRLNYAAGLRIAQEAMAKAYGLFIERKTIADRDLADINASLRAGELTEQMHANLVNGINSELKPYRAKFAEARQVVIDIDKDVRRLT